MAEVCTPFERRVTSVKSTLLDSSRGCCRYDEAETLLRRALKIRREVLGPYSLEFAATHANLGVLFRQKGEMEKALEHFRAALAVRRRYGDLGREKVAATLAHIGRCLACHLSVCGGSASCCCYSYRPSACVWLPPFTGKLELDRGQPAAAAKYFEEALELREKDNPNSRQVCCSYVSGVTVARLVVWVHAHVLHGAMLMQCAFQVASSLNLLSKGLKRSGHADKAAMYGWMRCLLAAPCQFLVTDFCVVRPQSQGSICKVVCLDRPPQRGVLSPRHVGSGAACVRSSAQTHGGDQRPATGRAKPVQDRARNRGEGVFAWVLGRLASPTPSREKVISRPFRQADIRSRERSW